MLNYTISHILKWPPTPTWHSLLSKWPFNGFSSFTDFYKIFNLKLSVIFYTDEHAIIFSLTTFLVISLLLVFNCYVLHKYWRLRNFLRSKTLFLYLRQRNEVIRVIRPSFSLIWYFCFFFFVFISDKVYKI